MPENCCYRVASLVDKGQGVVANRDIQVGELIIHEKPFIVLPWWIRHSMYPRNEKIKYLRKALSNMSQYDLQKFFQLHDSKCESGEEKTEDGIWRTNNFALGMAGARSDNGIFIKMSRFNHSCVPSAEFHWNEAFKRQEIRAIRKISEGEEITICYFTIEIAVHSQAKRKQFLQDHYGFPCDCLHCSLEGDSQIKNDGDRHGVYLLEKKIDKLLYYFPPDQQSLDSGDSGQETEDESDIELIGSSSSRSSRSSSDGETNQDEEFKDILLGLDLCFNRLQLMTELGFKVVSRLRLCNTILETAREWDAFDKEAAIVDTGLELARILHGYYSEEYAFWQKSKQRVNMLLCHGNNEGVMQAARKSQTNQGVMQAATQIQTNYRQMDKDLSCQASDLEVILGNVQTEGNDKHSVQIEGPLGLNKHHNINKVLDKTELFPIRQV